EELAQELADKTGMTAKQMREVEVSRRFEGDLIVDFPNAEPLRTIEKERAVNLLSQAEMEITVMTPLKTEEDLKNSILTAITSARTKLSSQEKIDDLQIDDVLSGLGVSIENAPKTSTIVPRYQRLAEDFRSLKGEVSREHPRDVDAAVDLVLENLPKFVYYSTYGNLDSEI